MSAALPFPSFDSSQPGDETSRQLHGVLAMSPEATFQLRAISPSGPAETIALPVHVIRLLAEILDAQSRGEKIALLTERRELTTHQAARLLKVSRPFLIEQCDRGLIPYRKVGAHRRFRLSDLLAYQQANERQRLQALEALGELDQKLGLGYAP